MRFINQRWGLIILKLHRLNKHSSPCTHCNHMGVAFLHMVGAWLQLPDGVRTDGVVAEVPQFPPNELSRKNVGETRQHIAECGNTCALKISYGCGDSRRRRIREKTVRTNIEILAHETPYKGGPSNCSTGNCLCNCNKSISSNSSN